MKCTARINIDTEDGKQFLAYFKADGPDNLEKKIRENVASFVSGLKDRKARVKPPFFRIDEKK